MNDLTVGGRGGDAAAFGELRGIFGGNAVLRAEASDKEKRLFTKYSRDQVDDERWWQEPEAVVFPESAEDTARLMRWANTHGIPVTPRGAGSGLAGAAIPNEGGVICSFERMNRIIEIDVDNLMAVVEPGVVTNALDAALKEHNLFFAGYPMSEDICFIGGNAAENAGGGRAVKYGVTSSYVQGAEVVTPAGEILSLGGKRLKDVTGYNLLQLFVGSEGTLGIFTKLVIRVIPRPAARGVFFGAYPTSRAAASCIADLKRRLSDGPSAIEFIDGDTARRADGCLPEAERNALPRGAGAFLLVEFDGADTPSVERLLEGAEGLVEANGGTVQASAADEAGIERAWRLRKQVPWYVKRTAGAAHSLEDVVVPPSAVPELVEHVEHLRGKYGLPIAVFGHAGDGNFHVTPMKAEGMSLEDWDRVSEPLLQDLYEEVVRLGGTISGEHGIGRKRTKYLSTALSEAERNTMLAIKNALDPNGILNPGVIFPGG